MKRKGLILSTIILFGLGLYLAYQQGVGYTTNGQINTQILSSANPSFEVVTNFKSAFSEIFSGIVNGLTSILGGSLVAAIIALALLVELVTLYPAVNIQLKQKKIHLFHKKLVDRFQSGELSISKTKRELDVLYAVNERIHRRGGALVIFQLITFVAVLLGLNLLSMNASSLTGIFSAFNSALLAQPFNPYLPVLVALAYLLHALIKIQLKQKEDYISQNQIGIALLIAFALSTVAFIFAGQFATLLSIYFLTQITFATMRYLIVEERAKEWGEHARRDLIKMLRNAELHKSKLEQFSRKFNHLAFVRHFNFHLLEEAASMSLLLMLMINYF